MQTAFFAQSGPGASSGSAFNSKRKRSSWCVEEFEYEQAKVSDGAGRLGWKEGL
jgi:hypothetical protein